MTLTQTIPVLDLQEFHSDRPETFVSQLGDALKEVGFFAIANHGVDPALIQTAYQVAEQFFDLPTDVKQRYERPEFNLCGSIPRCSAA